MSSELSSVNSPLRVAGAEPWKRALAEAIRDPSELCRSLGLPRERADEAAAAAGSFPLLVPRGFAARMRHGDPDDPLLVQVLPRRAERLEAPGFTPDPLGERERVASPGIVRKYAGRALLLTTAACAVNCRYCFRREFPYAEAGATRHGLDEAVDVIGTSRDIHEAILSGGDPLLLDDDRIGELLSRLGGIPHLRRIRIHSRLPIVLPERVTDRLVESLAAVRQACVVVVHANHPAELDESVAAAVGKLASAGAILLNQAVLLAGVNDSCEALVGLSERLVDLGVVPYYLHLLDRVSGTAHFDVSERRAVELHRELRHRLPGYAVPRLVREVPGEPAKVWLD